jgi:hypothetical protein
MKRVDLSSVVIRKRWCDLTGNLRRTTIETANELAFFEG